MFKNNVEDEADFCESYKSQILNNDTEERGSPIASILLILLLLVMIIALSIFGYNYIMDNKNSVDSSISVKSISDEELKVTEVAHIPVKEVKKETPVKALSELPKSESIDVNDLGDKIKIDMDVNDLADKIKIDMSKSEEVKEDSSKESKKDEEPLPVVTDSIESKYIEDLAKLTEEIDKERD